jgi:putative flippase GtrA
MVNLFIYYICVRVINLSTFYSTAIAWVFAVVFAFITNKIWVFESKSWMRKIVLKELLAFFLCRIVTGVLDVVIMVISVDIFLLNDVMMKAISNILVILLNYVASKMMIFRKGKDFVRGHYDE